MHQVTLKRGNMAVTLSNEDGESREELIVLISTALSWIEEDTIVLGECEFEEEETLYIEPNPPRDNIQHEGM
jgi:metal-dependent hydrolase (beta-lactamase superfamily II)